MPSPLDGKREKLRAKLIENAAEINRLHDRIHETFKRRDESDESHQEWSQACSEMHARYEKLRLPGGPYPDFYDRLRAGDPEIIEVALCFLEVRPYFFRSGYDWKTILQKCKRAPMSAEQSERLRRVSEKYSQWRKLRKESSQRGAAIALGLWPLRRRFYGLFPIRIADHKYDRLVTVGDLYRVICNALKIEPLVDPDSRHGDIRAPCQAIPGTDMSTWAADYGAWRHARWSAEDVWSTLTSLIRDVYSLGPSFSISPETILHDLTNQRFS
jgi:hypothetical protein